MPSPALLRSPSVIRAGNLLETTLIRHPVVLGWVPLSLYAMISGGVLSSFPGQKGQKPPLFASGFATKSVGLLALSVEIIIHRPTIGSFLNSGMRTSKIIGLMTHHYLLLAKITENSNAK